MSGDGVVWILGAAVAAVIAVALVDLSRHEARHMPRWAWAVFILVSFPLGTIAWFVVGRVSADASAETSTVPAVPSAAPLAEGLRRAAAADDDRGAPPVGTSGGAPLAVQTRGLTKRYGDFAALDEVDLAVPTGSTYGLIGPNGSGKTTMLSIIAGLRRPSDGEVRIASPRHKVGLLVDTPLFEPWLTAREVVDLARHLTAPDLPHERVEQTLVEVGLADAIDRRCGGFSRGMLQRLGLAGCLVGDPDILVLDEPSSALDPSGRRDVLDLIGRLAHTKTVLLSTHILSDVQQVCDVVGVLDRGRLIFQGPLADLLARTSTSYVLVVRPPATGVLDRLRERPWTSEVVEHAPGRIHLAVTDATAAERDIPGVLAACDVSLVSFSPATDLEHAFLELTA